MEEKVLFLLPSLGIRMYALNIFMMENPPQLFVILILHQHVMLKARLGLKRNEKLLQQGPLIYQQKKKKKIPELDIGTNTDSCMEASGSDQQVVSRNQ